jgi:selenocysteine lyase/cysteine desulfurase
VVRAQVTSDGRLNEDDVDRLLAQYGDRVAILTVSGASNVTGFIQPIHRLARKAHAVGARILVDAAQLAPHRRIDVRPDADPEHIDFVALSAHKMYAPFGAGALVGPREIFLQGAPEYPGGGTVELVTLEYVRWAGLPDREEAGSPNVVGAIAMAMAAQAMMNAGMESVEKHETALTAYALDRLRSLPELTIYGEADPRRTQERVGVISFNINSANHALVAAILGYEGGIGARSGCFCAQPYVASLLRDAETETARWRRYPPAGDKSGKPGMVRVSFGAYNSFDDVDALVEMLSRITRNEYQGQYYLDPESGEYAPAGYHDSIADYFSLSAAAPQSRVLTLPASL